MISKFKCLTYFEILVYSMHDAPQFHNISCVVNLLSAISNKYIYMTFCFHKYYIGLKTVIVNIKIKVIYIPTDAHAGKVPSTC